MASSKLRAYKQLLQGSVSLSDSEWSYELPSLPPSSQTKPLSLVKSVTLATKETRHQIDIRLQTVDPSRAISSYELDRFVLISFASFRSLHNQSAAVVGTQPSIPRECTEYIVKLLRAGVRINGVLYNFYGHSNSQLKSRTCFLFAGPKDQICKMVEKMGDFGKMKTVQKKSKRIGLLFSAAQVAMDIDPKRCEDIPDIETADYVFTDGCGLIAPRLAQDLARRARITFRNVRYTPSVFQIRYRGYKGVLTIDPRMKGETLIKMRKSMKKFSGGEDYSFSVVESSKPYRFGYLNDEVILLLHSLGISSETLLRKQQEHIDFLARATGDPRTAFRFLTYANQYALAERLLLESLDALKPKLAELVNAEYAKMVRARDDEQRCRILIPKSRLLFGVCDAWGVLKEGECQVRVTMDGDGLPTTLVGTEVLVTRNPCLHPGDLQKFKLVERYELSHLVDCIVFSTQGRRPAADLMSGGDLDGDTFFVSWDKDIIPSRVSQAAEYPGAREPVSFKPITDDDRLTYFAKYTTASLGRIKNLYLDWARVAGPMSEQCQELNRLFSTCVDGNRIKVPPKLEKPPQPPLDAPPCILHQLHEAAKELVHNWKSCAIAPSVDCDGYTFDAMEMLLSRDDVAVSEFELVQLTFKWCLRNCASLEDFMHFFNFNLLTAEEKAWTLSQLPAVEEYPSLVQNSLCQSGLLQEVELRDFKLQYPGLRWKRLYATSRDRPAAFLDFAAKALEMFHRKLLVFRVDDRLTVAVYIPQKIERARDCRIDDKARLFAFPHSQGSEKSSRLSLPTKINYHVYCDSNVFQLFEGRRANSWVFVGRGASDDSSYRNVQGEGNKRRARQATVDSRTNFDFMASIALNKFSRGLQTHVGRVHRNGVLGAEIYVISNRDVKSMRNLDLWLEYIDTQEVIPLFEQNAREYNLPTVKDVNWLAEPDYIIQVIKRQDYLRLLSLETTEHYSHLFSWLLQRDQKDTLFQVFDFLLASFGKQPFGGVDAKTVLGTMLTFLPQCPFLAVSFAQVSWVLLPGALADVLDTRIEDILRAAIISANHIGELMLPPFKTILCNARVLTIGSCARLVELIALTVRSPSLALDLLLSGLERESSRLLPYRPALVQHFIRSVTGIALEHVEEAAEQGRRRDDLLTLKQLADTDDGWPVVETQFRIDTRGGAPEISAHVRLMAATPPANSLSTRPYSVDALVLSSSPGQVRFQCFHPLPPFLEQCSWRMYYCGPFVTTKTMLDAVLELALGMENRCGVAGPILGIPASIPPPPKDGKSGFTSRTTLNWSQNAAIEAAAHYPLTCLWGPPGTGKTHTIVEIIKDLQRRHSKSRILVTAPTHNAVDNVMRRYLSGLGNGGDDCVKPPAIRVSTEVRKVSEDLRKHTCDAMAGQELHDSHVALRKAKAIIKHAQLVFTTCIGAGLGLLRGQDFGIVIIDEASQQTEPASLVPLTKGCQKAVLVGDHLQLRPTVGQLAQSLEFDVSLFERLWTTGEGEGMQCIMLDTQYRMHASICRFSSDEFYEGKLRTSIAEDARIMFQSMFPWPVVGGRVQTDEGRLHRMVFIECATPEDVGQKSKCNKGQATLCGKVCALLSKRPPSSPTLRPSTGEDSTTPSSHAANEKPFIAVLTPYTDQADLLKQVLSSYKQVEVCSIDGFQGREADVVIFVTVRCNPQRKIGFLQDLRRLNVGLTRARSGIIIIGNRATLTLGDANEESTATWKRLITSLVEVKMNA